MELNKYDNENQLQYIWRLASAKDSGVIDLTWDELTDVFNKNLNENMGSSTYRKPYQQARAYYEDVFSNMESGEYTKELEEKKRELERLKIQYRDERNAWNKQNYIDARIEQKLDYLEEQLSNIGSILFSPISKTEIKGDNDLIVCASDWHIGETFDSNFGEYNTDIARERLDNLLTEIVKIGRKNNSENVYICMLGDQVSGSIHLSIQVSNRENVIEQVKISAELFSSFAVELSKYFNHVYLISVAGNHSRLVSNKEKDIKDERLDDLIIWIVENMTKHISNITVLHRNLDNSIFDLNVRGKTYIGVHGDYDTLTSNSVGKLCMMLGFMPDYVLSGHLHTPSYKEFNGIGCVQSGSLAGSGDDYTIQKRLSGRASQTVLVCNDKGIDSIHNIKLN